MLHLKDLPSNVPISRTPGRSLSAHLSRPWVQLSFGLIVACINSLVFASGNLDFLLSDPNAFTTLVLALCVMTFSLFFYRRTELFPGVGVMSSVLPSVAISAGIVMMTIIALRLDYGRLTLTGSILATGIYLTSLGMLNRKPRGQAYYLIPSEDTARLSQLPGVRWIVIDDPSFTPETDGVIIADLRVDMSDQWERRIAELVLAGHQIYHSKQVFEIMTGKVQIEHLSENSFGSLAPSESYAAFKRTADVILSVFLLPFLGPLFLIVAIAIKLNSRGPVFFLQERTGYLGRTFRVVKFRTMQDLEHGTDLVGAAKTVPDDKRVTDVGRFLRRTRIDELPQIWNVLRGEMSWIGPRPEAVPLSEWYAAELPFYPYRHVIRPGITGWAQVNQGHVTELDEVLDKLHYDFFYIKRFSAWIDLTIFIRTMHTVFTGFGAR